MADLRGLEPYEQLTYWIGASTRTDVRLEGSLKRLWSALCGIGPGAGLRPRDARALIEQSRTMLGSAEITEELRSQALSLLTRASTSRILRNRLVHDSWTVEEGQAVATKSAEDAVVARKDVSDFRDAVIEATGIWYQIEAVSNLIVADLRGREAMQHPAYFDVYVSALAGEFEARDDGGIMIPARFEKLGEPMSDPGEYGAH